MSIEQCSTQPKTPGSLFRLPPELREIVWKMVIFNPSPRLCPLSVSTTIVKSYPNSQTPVVELDELFVYDYPSLRYICRDIRQETSPFFKALGWQFSGQGPPRRLYDPEFDILYPRLGFFLDFLKEYTRLLRQSGPDCPIPAAMVQVQNTRHLAIDYGERIPDKQEFETLFLRCPHVDKVSMIISNVGKESKAHFVRGDLKPSKRPRTLNRVPSLDCSSIERVKRELSEANVSAYATMHKIKKAYSKVEKESILFSAKADKAASLLGSQSLPTPELVMVLQLISPPTTEKDEQWEEVEAT